MKFADFDPKNPVPCILDDMPINVYHGPEMAHIVSHTYLSKLAAGPAKTKVPTKVTPAMIFGRALHKFVLEGSQAFNAEYAVMPDYPDTRDKKTSGWHNTGEYLGLVADFRVANLGQKIITDENYQTIKKMTVALHMNPVVDALIGDGYKEVTIIWYEEEGLWCKARPDGICPKTESVADLKQVSDGMSAEHPFQGQINKRTSQVQMAMVLRGINVVNELLGTGGKYDLATLIAVEDTPPYMTEDWTLDHDFINQGFGEFKRLLRIEKACREQNFWPNYRPTNLLNLRQKSPGLMLKPGYLSIEGRPWETTPGEER